jgi:hypothetical protein
MKEFNERSQSQSERSRAVEKLKMVGGFESLKRLGSDFDRY